MYTALYCGANFFFFLLIIMLFDEGQRFLLPVVMRVCPCVECKHLHILYGYIPAVRKREREDIVTEKTLLQRRLCIVLL